MAKHRTAALRHLEFVKKLSWTLAVSAAILGAVRPAAAASALASPWDAKKIVLTHASYSCPETMPMPKDVVASDFYSDDKHSVTDPVRKAAYDAAVKPFADTSKKIERAADEFQKSGSQDAAACVVEILSRAVAAQSMTGDMSSNQAEYVRNWTLGGLAVSLLKVRAAQPGTPEQIAAIDAWMVKAAKGVEAYFEPRRSAGKTDAANNHLYWAGFSVMSVGIATNDHGLYAWGLDTYKDGVNRIQPDGTLSLEMARGQRALHYHLFALAPLVMMAEMGEANGDDLYAFNHNKLHLLVARSLSGLLKNDYFAQKAGAKQDTPGPNGEIKSDDVEWARPFQRRFPDPMIAQLLQKAGFEPFGYIGGLPPE